MAEQMWCAQRGVSFLPGATKPKPKTVDSAAVAARVAQELERKAKREQLRIKGRHLDAVADWKRKQRKRRTR